MSGRECRCHLFVHPLTLPILKAFSPLVVALATAAITFTAAAQDLTIPDLATTPPPPAAERYEDSGLDEQTEAIDDIAGQIKDRVEHATELSRELHETLQDYADETDPDRKRELLSRMREQAAGVRGIYDFFHGNRRQLLNELFAIQKDVKDAVRSVEGETRTLAETLQRVADEAKREQDPTKAQQVKVLQATFKLQTAYQRRIGEITSGQLDSKERIERFVETVDGSAYLWALIEDFFARAGRQLDVEEGLLLLGSLDKLVQDIVAANERIADSIEHVQKLESEPLP